MSKPIYIFLAFNLVQRQVRLKLLKRDRIVDDRSTPGRTSANLTQRFETVGPNKNYCQTLSFELDCLITLSDK